MVNGFVERGFEAVRDAFAGNFAERGEQGAACAIYVGSRKVVDLWGGVADHRTGRPWTEDTLSLVWSATKGPAAMCLHLLAERGELELDAPIARDWPEFAVNGKERITPRMVLDHQAGLAVIDKLLSKDELLAVTPAIDALAVQAPVWEPGSTHGYHGITWGFLVSEIVRRVTGMRLGEFFAREIAAPLGLDFFIGLPPALEPRVCRIIPTEQGDPTALDELPEGPLREMGLKFAMALLDPTSLTARALTIGGFDASDMNDPRVHATEWAFGNAICDARSLARVYASCVSEVDGIRLLSDETIADATVEQGNRPDEVLFYPTRWASGFMLPNVVEGWLGESSFGFTGAGGHVGFADRSARVGFGYTMTKMFGNLTGDPRPASVIAALRACLT